MRMRRWRPDITTGRVLSIRSVRCIRIRSTRRRCTDTLTTLYDGFRTAPLLLLLLLLLDTDMRNEATFAAFRSGADHVSVNEVRLAVAVRFTGAVGIVASSQEYTCVCKCEEEVRSGAVTIVHM